MNQSLSAHPWHERFGLDVQEFSAAGVRTFAVVDGRPDAFPVIFLHGLPGGAFIWAAVIKALGRERLSIAPDLPGWGRSFSRFAKTAPDLPCKGLQAWLLGLLVAQNVQRFDLVAHGSSAWPAMELLKSDPSRVRRLALVSAVLWESGSTTTMLERLFGTSKWSPKKIERWLNERAMLRPNAREESRELFAGLHVRDASICRLPALSELEFRARTAEYRAALAAYGGAKLFIWGRNDPQAPDARINELAANLGGAEIRQIEGAGHFPMLDATEEVAALLKVFLAE